VLRGRLHARVGGRSATAGPGQVLWYGEGEEHHETVASTGACDWQFLLFTGPAAGPGHPLLLDDDDGALRQLMALISAAAAATDAASARKRDALCAALRAELERLQHDHPPGDDGLVGEVRQFIARHLAEPLGLERLATVAGMSRAHFARIFRARSGTTAMAAVRAARLAAARELLLTTELALPDIAARVGIGSGALLSRLLARHLGIGARALRRGRRRIGLG